MCQDGKCQERSNKSRPIIVSLGRAARDIAAASGRPQMVVQMDGYLAIGEADPVMESLPGLPIIISTSPTTTDEEIEAKADQFLARKMKSRASSIMEVVAAVLGATRVPVAQPTEPIVAV